MEARMALVAFAWNFMQWKKIMLEGWKQDTCTFLKTSWAVTVGIPQKRHPGKKKELRDWGGDLNARKSCTV